MVLPQTQGATQIYLSYVGPYLDENESEIDHFISSAHKKLYTLFSDYFGRIVHYAKEYVSHVITGQDMKPFSASSPNQQFQPNQQQPLPTQRPHQSQGIFSNNNVNLENAVGAGASSLFNKLFNKNKQQPPPSSFFNSPPTQASSYLDTFFSQFKSPPSLASPSRSIPSKDESNSQTDTSRTVWGSLLEPLARSGAAAIQASLKLQVPAEAFQSQISGFSNPITNLHQAAFPETSTASASPSAPSNPGRRRSGSLLASSEPQSVEVLKSKKSSSSQGTVFSSGASVSVQSSNLKSRVASGFSIRSTGDRTPSNPIVDSSSQTIINSPSSTRISSLHSSHSDLPKVAVNEHLKPSSSSASLSASDLLDFDFVKYEPEMGDPLPSDTPPAYEVANAGISSLNDAPIGVDSGSSVTTPTSEDSDSTGGSGSGSGSGSIHIQKRKSSWFNWEKK